MRLMPVASIGTGCGTARTKGGCTGKLETGAAAVTGAWLKRATHM